MELAETPLALQERAFGKCPLLYPAPRAPLVGRETDLEALAERLKQKRLAVIQGREVGVGATAVANAFAHRHAGSYPGGAYWIPYRVSHQQGLAADIIEALDLPAPVSQRYPFIGVTEALGTMWRGLHRRARTLLVIDGWTSADTAATWTAATETVHVIAIARPDDAVPEDCAFAIGPPDPSAAQHAVMSFGVAPVASTLAASGLMLSLTLRLLERGIPATKLVDSASVMREAIDSLDEGPRRFLGVLALLNDQPVPTVLLDAIYRRLDPSNSVDAWRLALASLVECGLCVATTFGEPQIHEPTLRAARERLGTETDKLRAPVVEAVVETLRPLSSRAVHSTRRLVPHTYAVLTGNSESSVPSASFTELIDVVSAGSSAPLAVIAARKGIELADAAMDARRKLRHQMALGHSFSQLGQLDSAQDTLRDALKTAEQAHGPDNIECADTIDLLERSIGLGVCGDSGPEVLALVQRAHQIRERVWGAESSQLRGSLEHLALYLAVRNRHEEALNLYQRALRLAERDDKVHSFLLCSVGAALADNERFEEAVETLDRLFDLEAATAFCTGLVALGYAEEILAKARQTDRLIVYVDRVLGGTPWNTDDEDIAKRGKVLAMRARALVAVGRMVDAASTASDAVEILERFYGHDHLSLPGLRALARGDDVA
jgi:tetratricopeptide (TPR) repeat protein